MDNNDRLVNKSTIKIATYNILLSRHSKEIINNIVRFANEGVQVFCLQEVSKIDGEPFIIEEILKHLGKEWKASYHLGDGRSFLDFGTCIVWDSRFLKFEKEEKISPPTMNGLSFHEFIFHKLAGLAAVTPPRRAISCLFKYKNTTITIASIHLDSVGGKNNRMKQLRYLLEKINKNSEPSYEIICGDFNSFDMLKTGQEKQIAQSLFGNSYIDASKDISWSADIYKMDVPKSFPFFVMLIKALNIHIKRKLDYIWVKNFQVKECKVVDVPGSDHLPVIATLALD